MSAKKATKAGRGAKAEAYAEQRQAFKSLLLTNPNYFGNLEESTFSPVLPLAGSTFYEELVCVGYQSQQRYLEAVVHIKQPSGYGSDICGPGSPEYVRFFLSYDNGVNWHNQGLTSFQAFDVAPGTEGRKRLEYAASLPVKPDQRLCWANPVIHVRAILSWNNPPPPNPNWMPVWGNRLDAAILVEPRRWFVLPELFKEAKIKLPPVWKQVVDLEAPIPVAAKALSAGHLAEMYQEKGVPPHRFAFKELSAFAAGKTNLSAEAFTELLPNVAFDAGLISALFPEKTGDTSYEELTCVGLDPNSPDTLVGVLRVKKTAGYSGAPCTNGSREYVTFWGDFDDNGSYETCLGTADVTVYDLANLPAGGVAFAVRLPVDLAPYRRRCQDGPVVVRIRAILSWNVPAPCANPNYIPTWGNRLDTLINIAPSAAAPAGKIAILGGIPVVYIDDVSGLTTPDAVFATNNLPPDNPDGNLLTADGRPCPFGGRVTVQGAPLLGHTYKVEVTPFGGGAPTTVVTDLILTRQDGTTFVHKANPVTLRFDYVAFTQNVNSVLAQWDTTGDALWVVRLLTYDGGGNFVGADSHLIQLDNTWPEASIDITTGLGNCGKFTSGTLLAGNFVARDTYLSGYSLSVEPAVNAPGVGVPSPSSGVVNTAVAPGDAWSLNTAGMVPCGYIIRVVASDRAIVNSQSVGHHRADSAGFCIEASVEEE